MTRAAPELARLLADQLERAGIPHAIEGALALAVWGFPRATSDVDLDVFVTEENLDPVFDALVAAGCDVDRLTARASAAERGDFKVRLDGMRIDVFVPSIPLYDSAARRIRRASLGGRPAWFLSPEDLATFKFLFFRTKDILDVERLVAFSGDALTRDHLRQWLVDLVGETDERGARWDRLVADASLP